MKHLYLFRHAKSSWDNPNVPDHDRPLARRGQIAGATMATVIAALDPRPDLVLCSTAVRAQSTLDLIRERLPQIPVHFDATVYTADSQDLRHTLARMDEVLGSILLIGHNPALEMLAHELASADTGPAMQRLRHKFPTAALAEVEMAVDRWSMLTRPLPPGTGRVRRFTRPSDFPVEMAVNPAAKVVADLKAS